MAAPASNPYELRFFHRGRQVLKLTERNVAGPRFAETAVEIPLFEATLHSDQPGLLGVVQPGQTLEAWARIPDKDGLVPISTGRVDHVSYRRDAGRESMKIQARSRAGIVVDRGCDASLTGTLAEVIARICEPGECVVQGIAGARRVSAHIRVGSSYAALRAIAVSLGAAVVHQRDGTLALVPTAPLASLLRRAPAAHIQDRDIVGIQYDLGREIKKR